MPVKNNRPKVTETARRTPAESAPNASPTPVAASPAAENILDKVKRASESGLVICFAGVGSAFAKKNAQTSMIIAKHGKTILVDAGTTIPVELATRGIRLTDFDAYHFTHSHSDHIGGVEELLLVSRYFCRSKPMVVISEVFQDILWEKSLKGGCEYNESGLLRFSDYAHPIRPTWIRSQPREMHEVSLFDIDLVLFRTAHIPGDVAKWERAFWSNGLLIDGKVLFSGDTRFDPSLFEDVLAGNDGVSHIFHDCQLFSPGTVHASYNELKTLPLDLRRRMRLMHYGDAFDQFDPVQDGFAGFTQPWEIYPIG